jgi:hypothetical protein
MKQSTALKLVVVAAVFAAFSFPATPVIGVATAVGTFTVNSASVSGTTSVLDGTEVQTTVAPSEIRLQNGVDVRLATRSAGAVFNDHVVLHEGAVRVGNFGDYSVNASKLEIRADDSRAQAIIRMHKDTVEIASIGGSVQVTDGLSFTTHVLAGTKVAFQQSGAAPAQTGAAPAPKPLPSDTKTLLWVIGVTAVAAIVIGSIAAAQGKSAF